MESCGPGRSGRETGPAGTGDTLTETNQPSVSRTAETSFERWNCPLSSRPVITSRENLGQSERTVLTKAIASPFAVLLNSAVTVPAIGSKLAIGRTQYLPVASRVMDRIPPSDTTVTPPAVPGRKEK